MAEKWNQSWDDQVAAELARKSAQPPTPQPPPLSRPPKPPLNQGQAAGPAQFVPTAGPSHVSLNCPRCGSPLTASSVPNTGICQKCNVAIPIGQQSQTVIIQQSGSDSGSKTAAILINALLFPGVGQFMIGRNVAGVIILLAWIASIALMCVGVGFITAPIVWVVALVDIALA